ncbi:uncharacterized protein LOC132316346 [Cornus florida]|uniref:uncharacterized protein LOC132316346 n=1 Tax=Cornus florida TaxID=4283 RepID=UPI00289B9004|nr:uncharacterized protein LOC132316346 [Cornus florida]
MDAFNFDNVKVEKANAMLRFHRLQKVAKLFRLLELCLVLVLISWTSTRLPFAVKISGEYFRQLLAIIVSPIFIFVLSNVIVVTLFAKSGQTPTAVDNAETDLCEELIRNSDNQFDFRSKIYTPVPEPEEIVFVDKQIICEVNTVTSNNESTMVANPVMESKTFRRTRSDNLKREISSENSHEKLRRSETDKFPNDMYSGEFLPEKPCLFEKLSNEEFQRRIEAFIAKQVKFHQEEKMIIVPQNYS